MMDLDEMKAGWNILNERLAQNEILNKRIIKEMITTKTKSAYDTLYHFELQQILLILFVGLILLPGNILFDVPVKWISFLFLEFVMFLALLVRTFLIYTLSKFNMSSMKVKELAHSVLMYKKYYWYNTLYGSIIGLGSVAIFIFLENTYTHLYAILTILALIVIGGLYTFTRIRKHEQKIKEVEQGLAELKEFESDML